MKRTCNPYLLLAALLVLAATPTAFAQKNEYSTYPGRGMLGQTDMGKGFDIGQEKTRGSDYASLNAEDYGYRLHKPLSKEDARDLDAARDQFLYDTRALREQIAEKRMRMKSEMIKQNPDGAKLTRLQHALSELTSQFDQEVERHHLHVRKLAPGIELGGGYGRNMEMNG